METITNLKVFFAEDFRGWRDDFHAPHTMKSFQPWMERWLQNNKYVLYDIYPFAIDIHGDLVSAYYEIPLEVTIGGETSNLMLRFAHTFRKENGEWRIVQSIVSSPSTGQSSAELVHQKQTSKK